MSVGAALRDLGRFLDACADDSRVSSVGLVERSDSGGVVTADIEVEVAACPSSDQGGLVLGAAGVDTDGTLQLTLDSTAPVVPTGKFDVECEVADATLTDGAVVVTLSASVPTDEPAPEPARPADEVGSTADEVGSTADEVGSTADEVGSADDEPAGASARKPDVPPFRNPELLSEVYESCDTFAEMTEALGMDVTPETVRRYMVDYDIHQPNSYDTGGDTATDAATDEPTPTAEAEAPVVIADGIGLPDDVTVETLIETVKRSNTIYEIKQDIGVGREDALQMLRELNLLDLVVGRLATEAERDISRDEIVDRLRDASATR